MINSLRTISSVTSRWWLMLGLGVVFGLRLIYVCSLPNEIDNNWRDGLSYDDIARNLISGVGYWDKSDLSRLGHEWYGRPIFANPFAPTARWMPGYPLFIAAIYMTFGESYRAVYTAQALLGVAIAGFIYLLSECTLGKHVGILAIFLYSIDFFSIQICGEFQTEQLFTLLVVASLYCFVKMRGQGRQQLRFVILFGLLAGVAALTRNVAGLMFGGLCLLILIGWAEGFRRSRFSTRVSAITIASVVFLGILAPWLIRNYKLTGHYVLSTETWQTLAMANNDKGGTYSTLYGLAAMPPTSIKQPEIVREMIYKTFVVKWITTHPAQFALFYLKRAILFWSPFLHEVTGTRAWLGLTFNLILLLFATTYAISHGRHWRELVPFYVTLLTFTVGYSLAFATTRFRLPLYPLLEILAAGGVLLLVDSLRNLPGPTRLQTRLRARMTSAGLPSGSCRFVGSPAARDFPWHGQSAGCSSNYWIASAIAWGFPGFTRMPHCASLAWMQIIVHMAAGMKGTHEFMMGSSIRGTQSIADAASLQGVKRVIYMSSLSVYDYARQRNGTVLTEYSPLEEHADTRGGAYSLGKRRAEDVALSHLADSATPWTILRPSLIAGNGSDICAPVGLKVRNRVLCLGGPGKRLPLVHVDDVAAAVLQVLQNPKTRGQVYVLSDPARLRCVPTRKAACSTGSKISGSSMFLTS